MTLIVLGIVAVLLVAGSAGLWAWLLVGVIGLVVLGAVVWWVVRRPRATGAPASLPDVPDDGSHRLLVIADGVCPPGDLEAAISDGGQPRPTAVHVVAPALGSRTARLTGDEHAYADAAARLDAILAMLTPLGVDAGGRVGSHDPLQALEDGLREFPARHVLFIVHEGAEENWLEHGVVDAARERFSVSVSTVIVPGDGAA